MVEGDAKLAGFVKADPKDDMVIASAIAGKADYIVTGDDHLIDLKRIEGIPILTPAEFVHRLESNVAK